MIPVRIFAAALLVLGGCMSTGDGEQDDRPEPRQGPRRSPDDVRYMRERGDNPGDGILDFSIVPTQWFDWKHRVEKATRIDFGLSYTSLFLKATDSLPGRPDYAASGDFDIFGQWRALGESGNAGILVAALEDRHKYTDIAPSQLGTAIGSMWPVTRAYDTHEFALTQLFWDQQLLDDRVHLRFGAYDHNTVYDTYTFRSEVFYFQNLMFAGNASFNPPGGGVGGAANWRITGEWYVIAGIADANGKRADPSLRSFFETREYYYILEAGFSPRFGPYEIAYYHVTLWHVDAREEAGKPAGSGFALTVQHTLNDFIPFLRYAWSDADPTTVYARQNVNTGVGIMRPFGRADDAFGFAAGAGQEVGGSRWQTGIEAFYRVQLTAFTQLTGSVQGIFNPLNNPGQDAIGVFGLRFRFQL
jgi:porin